MTRTRIAFAVFLNVLLVGTLLAHCVGCTPLPPGTPSYSVSDPAVVKLLMVDKDGEVGQCTAWKVDAHLAMTAGHCCVDDDVPYVSYTAEGRHAVDGAEFVPVIVDAEHDVCVLRGDIAGDVIRLATKDPQVGARVWTAGYPHGTFLISDGFWSGHDGDGDGVASTTVGGGASGSPVMAADGHAIGVLRARFHDMDGLTFTSRLQWMRAALTRARLTK